MCKFDVRISRCCTTIRFGTIVNRRCRCRWCGWRFVIERSFNVRFRLLYTHCRIVSRNRFRCWLGDKRRASNTAIRTFCRLIVRSIIVRTIVVCIVLKSHKIISDDYTRTTTIAKIQFDLKRENVRGSMPI